MSGTEEWTGRREAGRVGLTTMVNVIKGGSRDERTGDTVGLALGDDAQQCRAGGAQDIEFHLGLLGVNSTRAERRHTLPQPTWHCW